MYQVYTKIAYVPFTYKGVQKLGFLIINKDVCKSLSRKGLIILSFGAVKTLASNIVKYKDMTCHLVEIWYGLSEEAVGWWSKVRG